MMHSDGGSLVLHSQLINAPAAFGLQAFHFEFHVYFVTFVVQEPHLVFT